MYHSTVMYLNVSLVENSAWKLLLKAGLFSQQRQIQGFAKKTEVQL